jgi:hypothetical protein
MQIDSPSQGSLQNQRFLSPHSPPNSSHNVLESQRRPYQTFSNEQEPQMTQMTVPRRNSRTGFSSKPNNADLLLSAAHL